MRGATLIIGAVLAGAEAGLGAQDPLSTAKELYAAAAYEEALSALNTLNSGASAPDIARQAAHYRAFSLFALGRTREAEAIAEASIRQEPLTQLDEADVSPRIEKMFADVRKRLLPSLIRERFRTARSALDRKSFTDAEPPLTQARFLIEEAERLGVTDDGLEDLGVLVDGFLQLIRSTAEQQASTRPSPPSDPAPSRSAAASAASVSSLRVYSIDDEDVSPPVALDQRMPGLPMEMTQVAKALHTTGLLDLVIDETGRVVDATIRRSVNAGFDSAVLRSARRWTYRPAMKAGVAVRYVKTIALVP